jgi:hypothetical protein
MLHVIQDIQDPLCRLVNDDPVRPEIPLTFRVGEHTEIFVLLDDTNGEPAAAVCAAYRTLVPEDVMELLRTPVETPNIAVFYTIWSYKPGAGRKLILNARNWIQSNRKNISEFVTLSPPTEMARIFHLRNGAGVFRVNSETINYVYN